MFKKLKIKLTLLNLLVAGVILLGMAGAGFIFISSSIKNESRQSFDLFVNNISMQQLPALQNEVPKIAGMGGLVSKTFQFYMVSINQNGQVQGEMNAGPPMETDMVGRIVQIVLNDPDFNKMRDKITSFPGNATFINNVQTANLENGESCRYAVMFTSDYTYVIIQSLSQEKALLTNVGIVLGGCVLAGLLLLTLGGLFLAERSIRPIRLSWQKQRDFVADASHELRTPLAAIRSNIDVVLDDPQATVQEKQLYCQGIAEESKRMSCLVDNLLMLARADSDAVIFRSEPVDLSETAKNIAELMRPVAAKKNIALNLTLYSAPIISGDADRIKQVLLQLVDNALKYTPQSGKVEIIVGRSRDRALLTVCDNGIGIAPEHIEKIFERFYRADPSREREVGGHGLGLAIAKFIVERHGGTISASSAKGKGSVFTVMLPVKD